MKSDLPSPWDIEPDERPRNTLRPRFGEILTRGFTLGLLIVLGLALLGIAAGLGVYAYYAATLPSPEDLYQRASTFQSTKILDRNGKLLFEIMDPTAGRRTVVDYTDIPDVVIEATVATEDSTFFTNPGFSPTAIVRSLIEDLRHGDVVMGGSTITQQLVKNVYLTPEVTFQRKIKEAILAAEITRRYSKTEIMEIYLNEVYFGNQAYGIGAAAETYFEKPVSELTLSEAALLVGFLQAPAYYDPYTNPDAALGRRDIVLGLMRARGYIDADQYQAALAEPLDVVPFHIVMEAPHMVTYVREQLEAEYGPEVLYRGGLRVYTTLDLDLQQQAQTIVADHIATLQDLNAHNGALVALDPTNGDILAMVGSADFYDDTIDGQVNVTIRERQPGSAIKPLTYLAAMERGWSPSTMVMDVSQEFPDGANPPYVPTNYDGKEWGSISVRTALGSSRNIPAVSTLYQIGLPALLEVAQRLGITTLTRSDYGLSLTLGGGEVTLLELTGAYGALANGGQRVTPRAILRIEDQQGNVLQGDEPVEQPQVVDSRIAYLLTDILSDEEAREPAFGANNALQLPFPAAAKTGTTNDYRDNWAVGYTPDLVVGVWVGNNDNGAMVGLSGARSAAPIWHDFMVAALGDTPRPSFVRPEGIVEVEVCAVSGQKHTAICPDPARTDLFLAENVPPDCTVHVKVRVDRASGKLATDYCPAENIEEWVVYDFGAQWDDWARAQGYAVPPREVCDLHAAPDQVALQAPANPAKGLIQVVGTAAVAEQAYYIVEYGVGSSPGGWRAITPQIAATVSNGVLCTWDTREVSDGEYTLRVRAVNAAGTEVQARTAVTVRNAAPTATRTTTPAATATATAAPTATPAAVATATMAPSATPPATATPTATVPAPTLAPTTVDTAAPTATTVATAAATPTATTAPAAATPESAAPDLVAPTLQAVPPAPAAGTGAEG